MPLKKPYGSKDVFSTGTKRHIEKVSMGNEVIESDHTKPNDPENGVKMNLKRGRNSEHIKNDDATTL
jgi:hypothetical protein